jgi:two-component system, cell cycle sensor histidine kinase and response regulator CckA
METTLIVDDEDTVRNYIGRILRTEGRRVLEARDGEEALGLAREYSSEITLIITDVSMPRMNGIALANAVSEFSPTIPIILMSGQREEFWPERPSGKWTALLKPITREVLLRAICTLRTVSSPLCSEAGASSEGGSSHRRLKSAP